MSFFRIVNWKRFQHYKERNPPWIKLHRELLTSRAWISGDDAHRALMVALMLIAADTDNLIPADPAYIRRRAYLNTEPDFSRLLEVGFLERASTLLATCKQDARPETETETEKEKEQTLCSNSEKPSSNEVISESLFQSRKKATPEPTPPVVEETRKPTPKATATPCHEAQKLAALLSGEIRRNKPDFRITPGTQRKWAATADRMLRLDRRSYDQIAELIRWCQADEFWHPNVLSMEKLRSKFDALEMKARSQREGRNGNGKLSSAEIVERECTIVRARAH